MKNQDALNSVMYHLFENLRLVALMLRPVMPDTAHTILTSLGLGEEDFETLNYGLTREAQVINKALPLFKRLDMEEEMKYHESKISKEDLQKKEITYAEFEKLDLRVGEVVDCLKAENSDKLLILKIKIDDRVRQIVSSIADDYQPQELIGKKIAVLANLKTIKIRGHESEGMILCASQDGKNTEVLELFKNNSYSRID